MIVVNRRVAGFAALILLAVGLAACGDSEADQRKAFIKFLDDINRRVGVHFLVPTEEDRVAFGDYMRQYTVILDFNKDMKVIADDYQNGLKKMGIGPNSQAQTLDQMVARRQDFPVMKEVTTKTMQAYEARLAKANAERGALQQPDDLKSVYTKAFDKLITAPVQAMLASDKALFVVLDSSTQIADYVNEHRTKLTLSGSQLRANDAKTQAELNALIKAHQEAQHAGQRVTNGS